MCFQVISSHIIDYVTVYPKKYAHGFLVLCFVAVMQSFVMNSHEEFIHIHQGCFAGTGAIVRLPQCQWSKPDGYGKISQCITTTKHSKAKTVCIFLGIYCMLGGALSSKQKDFNFQFHFSVEEWWKLQLFIVTRNNSAHKSKCFQNQFCFCESKCHTKYWNPYILAINLGKCIESIF